MVVTEVMACKRHQAAQSLVLTVQERIIETLASPAIPPDLRTIIIGLGSRKPAVRAQAQEALVCLTPEQKDELVETIRSEAKRTLGRMGIWFALAAFLMVLGPVWLTFGSAGGLPVPLRVVLWFGFLAGYSVLFPMLVAKPGLQNALLYCALKVNDKRMIGPLISRSAYPAGKSSQSIFKLVSRLYPLRTIHFHPADIEDALIERIDSLGADEDIDLTKSELTALRMQLRLKDAAVTLRLIKLLALAGGSADLITLRSLTNGFYSGRDSIEVRQAAAECVETIEARINRQRVPQTLLRASQIEAPAALLVRPAGEAAPEAEEQLLRSSHASPPASPGVKTPAANPVEEAEVLIQ